jgi:glycerol-3-phosphate cytidylyltransferase
MKIGLIAGAFDVIHPGYIEMFKEAYKNCNALVIALHVDPTLERPTKLKPILSYNERYDILTSIKYIYKIYPYETEADLTELIKTIKPDIRFLGDDYKEKNFTADYLNIPIYYLDRSHNWSSTKFKKEIYNQINKSL